jgi:hypothetical protein
MRAFGWFLLGCGLLWALAGFYNVGAFFADVVKASTDAARKDASMKTAVALLVNGLLFIFPGLVLAGIGGLLARGSRRRTQRLPCPHCSELILRTAKVCRFCGRDVPARQQEAK